MNDHEFNAAYGSDAHSIGLLLREVNAGFLYDVVEYVYATIWARNIELSRNQRALVAVAALYYKKHTTALKVLLKSYSLTLPADVMVPLPKMIKHAMQMVGQSDSGAIPARLVAAISGDHGVDTPNSGSEDIVSLVEQVVSADLGQLQCAQFDSTQARSGALRSALQVCVKKRGVDFVAAVILQCMPYVGVCYVIPALYALQASTAGAEAAVIEKFDRIKEIITKKHQQSGLTPDQLYFIAEYCLGQQQVALLNDGGTLFTAKVNSVDGLQEEFKNFVKSVVNACLDEMVCNTSTKHIKQEVLNYIWIFIGCPATWQGHICLNKF